jgi:hypothetical protein
VNPKFYAVTSATSLGCSFLDWSIQWLTGQDQVLVAHRTAWQPITADPVSADQLNAHGHPRNHPSGLLQTQACVAQMRTVTGVGLASLYPFPLHVDLCCQDLGLDIQHLAQNLPAVMRYQHKDYQHSLEWLVEQAGMPVIYVAPDPAVIGHRWTRRAQHRMWTHDQEPQSASDLDQEYQEVFFAGSQHEWQRLGLTEIWDQRERMALDMRPWDPHWSDAWRPEGVHEIGCQSLWFDTEQVLRDLLPRLALEIMPARLAPWRVVLSRWQHIQRRALEFPEALPRIVEAIVRGRSHALPKLSLVQEAIIQHCLIYQHGLNLRTWNLREFPRDARQLHLLLESNIHPIQ